MKQYAYGWIRVAVTAVTLWGLGLAGPGLDPASASAATSDLAEPVGEVVTGEFSDERLPRTMKYGVLLPAGYETTDDRYPVLFQLYPGNPESHRAIDRWKRHVELARLEGRLPEVIVITPAIDLSMYQDPQGSGRVWEEAFAGPFLDHLSREFRLWTDRPAFFATGLSAGGAISLRLGLKYPEKFGAIAVLAPGIEAAASLDELTFEDTFWRPTNQYSGVDPEAWAAFHPLNIAKQNAERIRASGLDIYLESGNADSFMLDRGTEAMHRLLSELGIGHTYHLRDGVDHHVGTIMVTRWQEAYGFLGDSMRDPPPEPIVSEFQATVDAVEAQARKGIPDDPQINKLRMPIFAFSRRQLEIEDEELDRRLEAARR
ncbi:MAG: hypothetical protein HXY25_07785 [Alphaproteobacteria bacterium]|nr:hypothetical protein [Alphaproteobacteria bacterium]